MQKFLGKPFSEITTQDLAGVDRVSAQAEWDALSHEARRQLELHLQKISGQLEEFNDVAADFRDRLQLGWLQIQVGMQKARADGMLEAIKNLNLPTTQKASLSQSSRQPISSFFDMFFQEQGVGKKTEKEYRYIYELLIEEIGDITIGDLTDVMITEFYSDLPKKITPRGGRTMPAAGTMQKHATALKSFFNWAARKSSARKISPKI